MPTFLPPSSPTSEEARRRVGVALATSLEKAGASGTKVKIMFPGVGVSWMPAQPARPRGARRGAPRPLCPKPSGLEAGTEILRAGVRGGARGSTTRSSWSPCWGSISAARTTPGTNMTVQLKWHLRLSHLIGF